MLFMLEYQINHSQKLDAFGAFASMSPDDFMKHMTVDKKVSSGRIRFVLLSELGQASLISDYPDELLAEVLDAFCV